MHAKLCAATAIGILVASAAASDRPTAAQTTPPAPPGSRQTIPEKQSDTPIQGRSESLSSKLNKTEGVITPKGNIDEGIHAPAPEPSPNSTPVIPPKATGGDSAK